MAGRLQIPYMGDIFKSYSVETGRLQAEIDISLKVQNALLIFWVFFYSKFPLRVTLSPQDGFETATVIILDNVTLCGSYNTNLLKWHSHDLQNIFLQTSLNVKLPSIPWGNLSNIPVKKNNNNVNNIGQ